MRDRISGSSGRPSASGSTGGEYRALLRTARLLSAKSKCGLCDGGGGGRMTSACRVVSLRYGSMLKHEPDAVERAVEPVAVGRGQHRVSRDR